METQVRTILQERSGLGDTVQGIGMHESLWLLGMTSLDSVEVMLTLEETFGFEFPESRLRHATFATIFNIMRCIKELTESSVQ